MSTNANYAVEVEKYAERHFIASFRKKYKGAWSVTWKALEEEFKRLDTLIGVNNHVETIYDCADFMICKTEFRVAGTQESRHSSGNRCIIAAYKSNKIVRVLIVYSKTDVKGSRETEWWQNSIKDNYQEYKVCF
jgi:hypothetical protein